MPPKGKPPGPSPPPPPAGKPKPAAGPPASCRPGGGGLDLQGARASLKRVAAGDVRDCSGALAASALDSPEAVSEYQRYVQLFNIERWLDPLGDATFPTATVPLQPQEARAVIALHEGPQDGEAEKAAAAVLDAVATRLQRAIDDVGRGAGCMVKTSSRSAKDHAGQDEIRRRVEQVLAELPRRDENSLLVALSYASMELLRMADARQVMDVFVNSERIWHDMHLALAHEGDWSESLVARQWVCLEPDMEFRCFVAGGRVTGVSQYRHLVHFPRLLALGTRLQAELLGFLRDTVCPRLAGLFPGDNYVADLAVELQGEGAGTAWAMVAELPASLTLGRWWCIEVNPFFETTDGCLFSWIHERDLLEGRREGGAAPPEFRLQERSQRGALSRTYGKWKAAVDGLLDSGEADPSMPAS